MSHSRRPFLASLLLLFSAHLAFIAVLGYLRHAEPTRNLKLTSNGDYLILFGQGPVGWTSFRLFTNWSQLEKHLKEQRLELNPLVEVRNYPPQKIQVEAMSFDEVEDSKRYRIVWNSHSGSRHVLHAPDNQSARIFEEYIYFHGIEQSHLGFSVGLQRSTN